MQALGFDVVELSTGFISLPLRDWTNLVDEVKDAGLKVGMKREGASPRPHTVCQTERSHVRHPVHWLPSSHQVS